MAFQSQISGFSAGAVNAIRTHDLILTKEAKTSKKTHNKAIFQHCGSLLVVYHSIASLLSYAIKLLTKF